MKNANWENWTNLVLGIWLFITPWFIPQNLSSNITAATNLNFWVVGAVVIVSAGLALQELKPWEEWANMILGLWLIVSPWALNYATEPSLLWNSTVVGLIIAILSALALPVAQKIQPQKP